MGELDTKNDVDIVASDANPHRTGVYGEEPLRLEEPAVTFGSCCAAMSAISWRFRFRTL
jgi:hypothetical protein